MFGLFLSLLKDILLRNPCFFRCRLFRSVLIPEIEDGEREGEPNATWEEHFGEQWKQYDFDQLIQYNSNVQDLVSEYDQYREAGRNRKPLNP